LVRQAQRLQGAWRAHYHQERNHQGLDNALIAGSAADFAGGGAVIRRERMGGFLNDYRREAA